MNCYNKNTVTLLLSMGITYTTTVPIGGTAFVKLKKVYDYKECTIMEIIALLSIGVNVLLLI